MISTELQDNHDVIERASIDDIVYKFIKRLFDFLSSLCLLIVISPIFIVIAIAIKIDTKGPVFFCHKRVGYKGRELKLLKFRTMVDNAEDQILDFNELERKEWLENFKLKDDPRITKVGKFLRKTSLDELPQLLNIIGGSMSVVGPRPITQVEIDYHVKDQEKYVSVKPGLIGYWACHGRSNVKYKKRVELEMFYIDHASLWLDLKIMVKTVVSVFKQDGAV